MIIPEDDAHDFTPVEAPFITVGQEIVVMVELSGQITILDQPSPGLWVFQLDGAALGFFNDAAAPSAPWTTTYLYRRLPKPGKGAQFTAADGSEWIYPALSHGLYRCWQAGTTHGEGLATRAVMDGLTAPPISDPDYDYLPIVSGSELSLGDSVVWALGYQLVVDEIATAANDAGGTTYTFTDVSGILVVNVDHPPETDGTVYSTTQYIVTAHPPVGTRYTHEDGSRWIFQASKSYRCFIGSATYPVGMVLTRALIVGGMFEESA